MVRLCTAAFTGLALLASTGARANIVADPGFELNNGSWLFTSDFQPIGGTFHSGAAAAATGCAGPFCISQNFGAFARQTLTTTAGQAYTLSLYVADLGDSPVTEFVIYWNGSPVADVVNAYTTAGNAFTEYTYNVTAAGTSTTLQINGRSDPSNLYFDDVSIEAVSGGTPPPETVIPEPASLLLLGAATLGLVAARRRQA